MSAALKYEAGYGNVGPEPGLESVLQPTGLTKPLELGPTPIFAQLLEELNAKPVGNTAEEIEFDKGINTLVTTRLTLRDTPKPTPMNNEIHIAQNTDPTTYPLRIYPATYDTTPVEPSGPIKVDPRMHGVWQNRPFQPVQVDPGTHGVWTSAPTHTTLHDHRSIYGLNGARTVHFNDQTTHPSGYVTQPIDMEAALQFETNPVPVPNSPRAERALRLTDWARGGETTRNQIDTWKAAQIHSALKLVEAATTELAPVPPLDTAPPQEPNAELAAEKTAAHQAVAPEQSSKPNDIGEPINRIEKAHQPGIIKRTLSKVWGFVWKRRIPGLD